MQCNSNIASIKKNGHCRKSKQNAWWSLFALNITIFLLYIGAGSLGQSPASKRPPPRPATPRVNDPRVVSQPRRPPPPPPRRPPPQQRPFPQQQPSSSNEVSQAPSQRLCFINTVSSEGKDPKICVFPFTFRGKHLSKGSSMYSRGIR